MRAKIILLSFSLLFCISIYAQKSDKSTPKSMELRLNDKIKGNPNLSVIGHMTPKEEGANLVTRGNEIIPLKAQGWKAF